MRISTELLNEVFSKGVDGRNSNAYEPVRNKLAQVISLGMGERTISLNMLHRVLRSQVKKWEKEIDSWVEADN